MCTPPSRNSSCPACVIDLCKRVCPLRPSFHFHPSPIFRTCHPKKSNANLSAMQILPLSLSPKRTTATDVLQRERGWYLVLRAILLLRVGLSGRWLVVLQMSVLLRTVGGVDGHTLRILHASLCVRALRVSLCSVPVLRRSIDGLRLSVLARRCTSGLVSNRRKLWAA